MSAQVILGMAVFPIREADHLQVDGELVQIRRSSPSGYETVAVAGEDMLVTIAPAECAKVAAPAVGGHTSYPWASPSTEASEARSALGPGPEEVPR